MLGSGKCACGRTGSTAVLVVVTIAHALLAAYSVKDQSVQKLSRMETGMDTIDRITFSLTWAVMITTMKNNLFNKLSHREQRDDMSSADGSSTRGGSTSVRGRVRSPHMAKLQAARVPIA